MIFLFFIDTEAVVGDVISFVESHSSILQAIYGYSLKHYNLFKPLYPDIDCQFGMFGKNLTLDDLNETKIHQGDVFKVGEAILEASKQRNSCLKLGICFNNINSKTILEHYFLWCLF